MDSQYIYNLIADCHGHHPAYTMDFDTLYAGLQAEIAVGNIVKQTDKLGELELYGYTIQATFDGNWNIFSLMARGLILCPLKKKIVGCPFFKFFNWSEGGYFLPCEKFSVTEKIDGSLGVCYFWNNDWQVATRGSFVSEQAQWAKKWLDTNVDKSKLVPGSTYLAEIIYAENRIVIPYDFEGLVLLSVFNDHGVELCHPVVSKIAEEAKFTCVAKREYFNSIDDMVKICETLPHTQEGFVVRFESGYRLKIKGAEYLRVHRLISYVTPLRVWESMLNGDDTSAIRKELPEEIRNDYDTLVSIFSAKKEIFVEKMRVAHDLTKHLSDKELGLALKNNTIGQDEDIRNSLFLVRKKDLLIQANVGGSACRRRVFGTFKPNGNKLPGYQSSNSINRFSENKGESDGM